MRLAESPWVTDENIHPEVVAYLRSRGLDVVDVKEQGWQGRRDEECLDAAYRAGRIVLTHDGTSGRWHCLEDSRSSGSYESGRATFGPT